jgi:hypothetical protein
LPFIVFLIMEIAPIDDKKAYYIDKNAYGSQEMGMI